MAKFNHSPNVFVSDPTQDSRILLLI